MFVIYPNEFRKKSKKSGVPGLNTISKTIKVQIENIEYEVSWFQTFTVSVIVDNPTRTRSAC